MLTIYGISNIFLSDFIVYLKNLLYQKRKLHADIPAYFPEGDPGPAFYIACREYVFGKSSMFHPAPYLLD